MAAATYLPSLPPRPTKTSPSPIAKTDPITYHLSRRASLPTTPAPLSSPTKSALKAIGHPHNADCRACTAAVKTMSSSRYYPQKRSVSPGSQKLSNVGRSSDGNFGSTYSGSYGTGPHDHRHSYTPAPPAHRKTGGVIPISTEIVYKDPYPSSSSSAISAGIRDSFSGRPRRSSDLTNTTQPLRSRPAVVQEVLPRPGSPLSRGYEARDGYVKSNTSVRREAPKSSHKLYSVDNSSAKLIAETDYPEPRRERGGYHLTGSTRSSRPREVDDQSWSYTDPAGMYNDTEPIRRARRGSVEGRRPTSVIEPYGSSYSNRMSRDYGPPPTTRHVEKVNDLARGGGARDPVRSSSRDRQGTYDSYGQREAYDIPLRSAATMPVAVHQFDNRSPRDDPYYRDDYDHREPRKPTRQFTDDAIPVRGFGLRMPNVDGRAPGGSNSSSREPAYAAQVLPYGGDALAKMPSGSEFMPPPPLPIDDRRNRAEFRELARDRDAPREREFLRERDLPREREVPRDREGLRERDLPREREPQYIKDYERPKDRDYERDKPRDRDVAERDRPKERDRPREASKDRGSERHHHRRLSKDVSDVNGGRDSARDLAGPAVTTAAGLAGAAAVGAAAKKHHDRRSESDEERDRRSRRELDTREDDRDRRYTDKEREDRRRDDKTVVGSDEEYKRRSRREPNEHEDEKERQYAEKDRDEKKRDVKPVVDADEDYMRRVAQAQAELAGIPDPTSTSKPRDEGRSDERSRHRDREHEDRDRRRSVDRGARRGSDENEAPPAMRSRARAPSIDAYSNAPHNRLPDDRSFTDQSYVQEPDVIPGAYPQDIRDKITAPPAPSSDRGMPRAARSSALVAPDSPSRSKSVDPSADRRVTIVEPPKSDTSSQEPKVRGILRKPTEKFPDYPDQVREGVTPLKERLKEKGKDIPDGAKWTKIDRRLVNPQALEEKGERFEERENVVIVLRVLTKDEIQEFADRTNEIRGMS